MLSLRETDSCTPIIKSPCAKIDNPVFFSIFGTHQYRRYIHYRLFGVCIVAKVYFCVLHTIAMDLGIYILGYINIYTAALKHINQPVT